jgi:hypothetical protein
MNESDVRAELQRLAGTGPAGPARLDIDKMLRHGRRRIRRRRAGAFQASVAAAALVVLSSVGIIRLTSGELSGPPQPGTPSLQIPEAAAGMNPANPQWMVPANYPAQPRDVRLAQQVTLAGGHVAF